MMTSSWIVEYYCFEYYSCKLNCVYGPTFTQICCLNHMQIQQLSPIVPQRPNQIKSATHPNKQIVGPLTLVTMHVLFNLLIQNPKVFCFCFSPLYLFLMKTSQMFTGCNDFLNAKHGLLHAKCVEIIIIVFLKLNLNIVYMTYL